MKQHRQARQGWKTEPGTYVDCAKGQHARRQGSDTQPGHDGGSDRRNAAADKALPPGHGSLVKKRSGQYPDTTGFGKRGHRQGLVRTMPPIRRGEPAELLLGEQPAIASSCMQADDHHVDLTPVKTLNQVAGRSNPDLDQQLRILGVHAGDQRR